ncbi:MAG: LuxR family transcriptional regulator [Pseudomonadota bacterium]
MFCADSADSLQCSLKKLCGEYFIDTFALAALTGLRNAEAAFDVFDNYPIVWKKRYIEKKHYLNDPVFSDLNKTNLPFCWNVEKFKDITKNQEKFLYEAHDFGVNVGTTIPLLPDGKFNGFITLLGANIHHPELLYIFSLAANFYLKQKKHFDLQQQFKSLTKQEMKVLLLKADGLSVKIISSELHLSDATVIFHLKNLRKKLNSVTTEQAIFKFGLARGDNFL